MRLIVEKEEIVPHGNIQSRQQEPVKNAFEVMMLSQRAVPTEIQLPARIDTPQNNKDKLFNDLVNLFEEKNWKWSDGGATRVTHARVTHTHALFFKQVH